MEIKTDKRLIIVFFVILLAAVMVLAAIRIIRTNYQGHSQVNNINNGNVINQRLIGNERDQHGCLIPAGYSWCEIKKKCLRTWEETCQEPEQNQIIDVVQLTATLKLLFADKYQKNIKDITIQINQANENYVRGGVKLSLEKNAEGANFLAAKINNEWQIVYDGNGSISCNLKEQYGFPDNMLTDCSQDNQTVNNNSGIANPASVYCEEHNGELKMVNDENGTAGVCVFADGSSCDEWAYFRNECQPGENK